MNLWDKDTCESNEQDIERLKLSHKMEERVRDTGTVREEIKRDMLIVNG